MNEVAEIKWEGKTETKERTNVKIEFDGHILLSEVAACIPAKFGTFTISGVYVDVKIENLGLHTYFIGGLEGFIKEDEKK